jgi:hypothetical protein
MNDADAGGAGAAAPGGGAAGRRGEGGAAGVRGGHCSLLRDRGCVSRNLSVYTCTYVCMYIMRERDADVRAGLGAVVRDRGCLAPLDVFEVSRSNKYVG